MSNPKQLYLQAALHDDVGTMVELETRNVDKAVDERGNTALHLAIQMRARNAIHHLLTERSKQCAVDWFNHKEETAFNFAVRCGDLETMIAIDRIVVSRYCASH